jgi:hypothetical protein
MNTTNLIALTIALTTTACSLDTTDNTEYFSPSMGGHSGDTTQPAEGGNAGSAGAGGHIEKKPGTWTGNARCLQMDDATGAYQCRTDIASGLQFSLAYGLHEVWGQAYSHSTQCIECTGMHVPQMSALNVCVDQQWARFETTGGTAHIMDHGRCSDDQVCRFGSCQPLELQLPKTQCHESVADVHTCNNVLFGRQQWLICAVGTASCFWKNINYGAEISCPGGYVIKDGEFSHCAEIKE